MFSQRSGFPLKQESHRLLNERLPISVAKAKQIAQSKGICSVSVLGNDRLVEFYANGRYTTVHTSTDLDTFSPRAILRLVDFFPALSVELFWGS